MAAGIRGGVAGWLVAILPLLTVNALNYFGVYYMPDPIVAGLAALFGGLVLGGAVAALLGGRRRAGLPGAATSGITAAVLYAASLLALLAVARGSDAPPPLVAEHPIRVSAGILFFAALLLLVALVTGAVRGSRESGPGPARATGVYPQHRGAASFSAPRQGPAMPYSGARGATGTPSGATRPRVSAQQPPHSGPTRYGGYGDDDGYREYGEYGEYGESPRPSRPLRGAPSEGARQSDQRWR